jgi:hypothetical protein
LMNLCNSRKRISSGSNHFPLNAGESIKRKKHEMPRMTVTTPSNKKIHLHLYAAVLVSRTKAWRD